MSFLIFVGPSSYGDPFNVYIQMAEEFGENGEGRGKEGKSKRESSMIWNTFQRVPVYLLQTSPRL